MATYKYNSTVHNLNLVFKSEDTRRHGKIHGDVFSYVPDCRTSYRNNDLFSHSNVLKVGSSCKESINAMDITKRKIACNLTGICRNRIWFYSK